MDGNVLTEKLNPKIVASHMLKCYHPKQSASFHHYLITYVALHKWLHDESNCKSCAPGNIVVGANVQAKHPEKSVYAEAVINKIQVRIVPICTVQ